MTFREYVLQARRDYIIAVLEEAGHCVTKAAQIANIDRTQLHKHIARLGIQVNRGGRYGNRGNAEWQALGLAERLQATRRNRVTSMSQKCQHE